MEESDAIPLLTRDGTFKVIHQVWAWNQSDSEEETNIPRCSSVQSALSQAPEMDCSESLSQISSQVSEPSEERKKLTRVEAYHLLREATNAAEAAQRALEHIYGEDFNDATGEELEARDNLVKQVQRNLLKLQKETQRRSRHVKDPNKTFLSTSACEDFGVQIGRSEATAAEPKNEKGIQTESCTVESKAIQTENESKSKTKCQPFRKSFDQLKVIRLN